MSARISTFLIVCAGLFAACDSFDEPAVHLDLVYIAELQRPDSMSMERADTVALPDDGAELAFSEAALLAAARASGGEGIDLGEIRGTRSYFFLLRNRGGATVRDVQLEIAGPGEAFSVSPAVIAELPAFHSITVEQSLAIGLIRVTVEHGISATADGAFAPLLPAGPNHATITASVSGAPAGGPHLQVELDLYALLTDVRIFDGSGEVDLLNPDGHILTGGFETGEFVPRYLVNGDVRVVNSGNVDVVVERFLSGGIQPYELAPGAEFQLADGSTTYLALAQTEAVRDLRRWRIFGTGKSYVYLQW